MIKQGLSLLAQGARWVVVDKPAGIGVEKQFDFDTVEARALRQFARPGASKPPFVGIVHRLDRPVSGALLLARNQQTLVYFNQSLARGELKKTYWALTAMPPPSPEAELRHFLARAPGQKRAIAALRPLPGAQEARLRYRYQGPYGKAYHLLEIELLTGRFHQIRAQLSAIGCPIIGDAAYGSLLPWALNHIALHARNLTFLAPGEQDERSVKADPPGQWGG